MYTVSAFALTKLAATTATCGAGPTTRVQRQPTGLAMGLRSAEGCQALCTPQRGQLLWHRACAKVTPDPRYGRWASSCRGHPLRRRRRCEAHGLGLLGAGLRIRRETRLQAGLLATTGKGLKKKGGEHGQHNAKPSSTLGTPYHQQIDGTMHAKQTLQRMHAQLRWRHCTPCVPWIPHQATLDRQNAGQMQPRAFLRRKLARCAAPSRALIRPPLTAACVSRASASASASGPAPCAADQPSGGPQPGGHPRAALVRSLAILVSLTPPACVGPHGGAATPRLATGDIQAVCAACGARKCRPFAA